MNRSTALTLGLVVAAMLAVPVVGAAATGGDVVAQQTNDTDSNASVSPGERLSGVLGVQEAELEGEVDRRAFGLKVARAASDDARAEVVQEQLGNIQQRLANLSAQKEALNEARANGSISEGEYAAKVSELAARGQTVSDLANETNETASGLPTQVLEANGINVSAIQQLKKSASDLTGPEVAAIAQSIAGPNVGKAPQEVPRGGPEDRPGQGNATDGRPTETPEGTDTPDGTETPEGTDTPEDTETEDGTSTDADTSDGGNTSGSDNAGGGQPSGADY